MFKYHQILTRTVGEEAFKEKSLHHWQHAQWIAHKQVPISCPLEPSRYLALFARYLAPNLRQRLLRDDVISDVISPCYREENSDISYSGSFC